MDNKKNLAEILRRILLEIRLLSSNPGEEAGKRINRLVNIGHNIPLAIIGATEFDENLLRKNLREYVENNPSSGIFDDVL